MIIIMVVRIFFPVEVSIVYSQFSYLMQQLVSPMVLAYRNQGKPYYFSYFCITSKPVFPEIATPPERRLAMTFLNATAKLY